MIDFGIEESVKNAPNKIDLGQNNTNATIKAVPSPVIAACTVVSASSAIDSFFIYLVFFVSGEKACRFSRMGKPKVLVV